MEGFTHRRFTLQFPLLGLADMFIEAHGARTMPVCFAQAAAWRIMTLFGFIGRFAFEYLVCFVTNSLFSDDRGRTWYNNGGTKVATTGSTTVSVSTSGIIVDSLDVNHGLVNVSTHHRPSCITYQHTSLLVARISNSRLHKPATRYHFLCSRPVYPVRDLVRG